MDSKSKRIINSLAQDIIIEYELKIPVDAEKLLRNIGGELIEEINLFNGSIKKHGSSFTIRINKISERPRKRMAIAHELGHLFLHMGFKTSKEIWNSFENDKYYSFASVEYVYQANEFAHALLLPENFYRDIITEYADNGKIDVSIIAEIFDVPIEIASVRGKNLELLKR